MLLLLYHLFWLLFLILVLCCVCCHVSFLLTENAEAKVWHRLNYFKSIKSKNRVRKDKKPGFPIVGVLGCMAERLKTSLLEEESVDFVCGPDAYRDIPLLVEIATASDQKAANVQLSLEETYADIAPVRQVSSTSAFVSIMRGCNNMCACKSSCLSLSVSVSVSPLLLLHPLPSFLCELECQVSLALPFTEI